MQRIALHLYRLLMPAVSLLLLAADGSGAFATGTQDDETDPLFQSTVINTIGVEGVYYIRHGSEDLEVRPAEDDAKVKVWIAKVVPEDDAFMYEVRYIADYPGNHFLEEYLVDGDGKPARIEESARILVRELLPADHDGSLGVLPDPEMANPPRYKLLLVLIASIWMIPALWFVLRKCCRPVGPESQLSAKPTLADQLHPLVEAAVEGRITRAQQARLELLLIAYWRERLDLSDKPVQEALQLMRKDRQAGPLLHQLEAWLHHPPGIHIVDVSNVLEPYRAAEQIDERLLDEATQVQEEATA